MNPGLDPSQIKTQVIEPVLALFPARWNTPAAVNLLLGTMLVESGGIYVRQLGGGPALGVCQMEPATLQDCYDNFLDFSANTQIAAAVGKLTVPGLDIVEQLEGNLYYAFAMARVKYIRAPAVLPEATDYVGLANYHKDYYNTALGATVVGHSQYLFQEAIAA
jgi:hypothetical protein